MSTECLEPAQEDERTRERVACAKLAAAVAAAWVLVPTAMAALHMGGVW